MQNQTYDEAYVQYQRQRSGLRVWVRRRFYLQNLLRFVRGRTIDLGCGIGELLALLPPGSVGLEVNPAAVRFAQSQGLDVRPYDPIADDYRLADVVTGNVVENNVVAAEPFGTLVMAHVLEHLDDPDVVIRKLLATAERLGLQRVLFVVPGVKGFRYDATHRTFIDQDFFRRNNLNRLGPYRILHQAYFPVDSKAFSRVFTHNELVTVYART